MEVLSECCWTHTLSWGHARELQVCLKSWQCGAADCSQDPSRMGAQTSLVRQWQTEWGLGARSPLHGDEQLMLPVTETRVPGQWFKKWFHRGEAGGEKAGLGTLHPKKLTRRWKGSSKRPIWRQNCKGRARRRQSYRRWNTKNCDIEETACQSSGWLNSNGEKQAGKGWKVTVGCKDPVSTISPDFCCQIKMLSHRHLTSAWTSLPTDALCSGLDKEFNNLPLYSLENNLYRWLGMSCVMCALSVCLSYLSGAFGVGLSIT